MRPCFPGVPSWNVILFMTVTQMWSSLCSGVPALGQRGGASDPSKGLLLLPIEQLGWHICLKLNQASSRNLSDSEGRQSFPDPIHVASGLGPDWPQRGHGIAPEQQLQVGTSYRSGFSNTHLSAGRACVSLLLVHSIYWFLLLLLPTALLGTARTLSKPPGQLRCCVSSFSHRLDQIWSQDAI